jgi:hypothetical protein
MLTLRDAARVAGMRRSTIKLAIRDGLMPRSKQGFDRRRPYRINTEELIRFARGQKPAPMRDSAKS